MDRQNGPDSGLLDAWQLLPELPLPGDFMASNAPPLPIPLPEGETPSKKEYLEYQYGCQRIEAVEPLRQAVNQFRQSPGMTENHETYVYSQVHIQGYVFTRYAAACRISFSTERSPDKVDWRQSKRLTPGSLVVLSPRSDNFKSQCYIAVVATRNLIGGLEPDYPKGEDDNTPPRIHIYWADPAHAKMDPSLELVMLEAKDGYFEAVRFAMTGLQRASFQELVTTVTNDHVYQILTKHHLVPNLTNTLSMDVEATKLQSISKVPVSWYPKMHLCVMSLRPRPFNE